jgi:hypothetical protein
LVLPARAQTVTTPEVCLGVFSERESVCPSTKMCPQRENLCVLCQKEGDL